jgi:hypothetical protein
MRMLAVIALLASAQSAFAMNWEGHDDWMSEFPPVQPFIDATPEAKPPPPRDCPVEPVTRADNPYDQIPLPQHNCPALQPGKLPGS